MDTDLLDRCARARFFLPPDAVVTGSTALRHHGVGVGDAHVVRAATATGCQTRRSGVRLARVARLPDHAGGFATPLAAWCDARTELDLVDLVAAGDTLVRVGLVHVDQLRSTAAGLTGRGCRHLRRAAALVRDRVDSPPETRLRLCLVLAGLPEPRTNVVLGHEDRVIGRVDLLIEEFGVVLEYDGDQHRASGQWNVDLDRDDAFAAASFATLRVTCQRLRRPRQLVRKVHALLVRRGYAGPGPAFDDEWVALFEHRE